MGAVQLQRGGQLAPYTFPDTWSTRQAATIIAVVEGATQGIEWWYGDWRLFYDPTAVPGLGPNQMADPAEPFSRVSGHIVMLGWLNGAEYWN